MKLSLRELRVVAPDKRPIGHERHDLSIEHHLPLADRFQAGIEPITGGLEEQALRRISWGVR
jgi:hypothetical protein